ncbi:AAA family ATPase [candidate division WOR-3 bacterium]|nr:AAA family ATPase [candidate division WOR-3 bacterium]
MELKDDYEKEVLTEPEGQLKIVEFHAEHFKALKAVGITPQGNIIKISGPNAAGKSSILHAIEAALGGKNALKNNPDPVQHGEKTAEVTIDLGKYKVTRTWIDGVSKLKIINKEGVRYSHPSGVLSSIVGDLSFDPLIFKNQSNKDQVKTLLELIDLPIDLYALDDDRENLYNSRRLVNRAVKHLGGKVAGFPLVNVPDTEINTSDIMSAMELATKTISDNKDVRFNYEFKQDAKDELITSISALETELLRKQDRLVSLECEINQLEPQVDSLIDPDLTVFKDQLQNAEQINTNVRSMQQRNLIIEELNGEKNNSESLTAKIKEIDDLKERTIREAEMPIDGLGFNDLGVTFNDTLIKQCSTAEQHRISVAIGMAMNPKLRVILIDDGSALDSNTMKDIEDLATNKGYQLWIGVVDETGKIGICIEDGIITHDNYVNPQ